MVAAAAALDGFIDLISLLTCYVIRNNQTAQIVSIRYVLLINYDCTQ